MCVAEGAGAIGVVISSVEHGDYNSVMTVGTKTLLKGIKRAKLPKGMRAANLGLTLEHEGTTYVVVSIGLKKYVKKAYDTYFTHVFEGQRVHLAVHGEVVVSDNTNGGQMSLRQQPVGCNRYLTPGGNADLSDFDGNTTIYMVLLVTLLREFWEEACRRLGGKTPLISYEKFIWQLRDSKVVFTSICDHPARPVKIAGRDFGWPDGTSDIHANGIVFVPTDLVKILLENFEQNDEVSSIQLETLSEEFLVGRDVLENGTGGWKGLQYSCSASEQPNGAESFIVGDIPQFRDMIAKIDAAVEDMGTSQPRC
jgi:hypothetical protein